MRICNTLAPVIREDLAKQSCKKGTERQRRRRRKPDTRKNCNRRIAVLPRKNQHHCKLHTSLDARFPCPHPMRSALRWKLCEAGNATRRHELQKHAKIPRGPFSRTVSRKTRLIQGTRDKVPRLLRTHGGESTVPGNTHCQTICVLRYWLAAPMIVPLAIVMKWDASGSIGPQNEGSWWHNTDEVIGP